MRIERSPDHLTLTLETASSSFISARLCSCNHPVRRHVNAHGVGCTALMGVDGESCPCALENFEVKFLVIRGLASPHDLIQVKRADRMSRFIRQPLDGATIPPHFRWFVRPGLRANLFVLFPKWVDAIEFATRDWSTRPPEVRCDD